MNTAHTFPPGFREAEPPEQVEQSQHRLWDRQPKVLSCKALHRQVLVALIRGENYYDYSAYIFPVPGKDHEEEQNLWRSEGTKITEEHALFLFDRELGRLRALFPVKWRK